MRQIGGDKAESRASTFLDSRRRRRNKLNEGLRRDRRHTWRVTEGRNGFEMAFFVLDDVIVLSGDDWSKWVSIDSQ